MWYEALLSSIDLGGLLSDGMLTVQTGLFAGVVLLVAASFALSAMAFRSAGAAQRARRDAESKLAEMENVARGFQTRYEAEIQRLSSAFARAEPTATDAQQSDYRVRVGAMHDTPLAEADFSQDLAGADDATTSWEADADAERRLAAAHDSASVPHTLLKGPPSRLSRRLFRRR